MKLSGKSICIYVIYDKQNIVDAYIGHMLSELRKNIDYIVAVCNMENIVCGEEYIAPYVDEIFRRKNIGYDAGAFKDVLCDLLGWEKILCYDELYLINDSFFGPFKPMKDIFDEMGGRNCDFWGLLVHAESKNEIHGYIPSFMHSFFICIKKIMLCDDRFRKYWEEMPYYAEFGEVINKHELVFTRYFSSLGYHYSSFANEEPNNTNLIENNFQQYTTLSYELITKRNFPFLKKQQLAYNTLNQQTQENLRKSIEYIDKHTDYDVNLIWDNITRTLDRKALQHSLHLKYIISDECGASGEFGKKVILIRAQHFNACEYVFEYIEDILGETNVCIVTDLLDIESYYRGRNITVCDRIDTELLKANYDFICLLSDMDMSSDIRPSYINKSHFFGIWNNLIKNNTYISNVLAKFRKEERLGFLYTPRPVFAHYFGQRTFSMDGWVRSDLLDCYMQSRDIDDFEEKVWQHRYYSGTVESSENASINETNSAYYLETLIDQVKKQYGEFVEFSEMKKLIFKGALYQFCSLYSPIYIYGTGFMAKQYKDFLPMAKGYVVSDGQDNAGEMDGHKIWYLSELEYEENMGVVVCVDLKYQNQIIPLLEQKGIYNYICI